MKNVSQKVQGNKLILEIDLSKNFGPSKTGKTTTIASSEGFARVEGKDGLAFSLNVNQK